MGSFGKALEGISLNNTREEVKKKDNNKEIKYSGITEDISTKENIPVVDSEGGGELLTGYIEELKNDPEKWEIIQQKLKNVEITESDIEENPTLKEITDQITANLKNTSSLPPNILKTIAIGSLTFALSGCINNTNNILTPQGNGVQAALVCSILGTNSYQCKQLTYKTIQSVSNSTDIEARQTRATAAYNYGKNVPTANCNVYDLSYEVESCENGKKEAKNSNPIQSRQNTYKPQYNNIPVTRNINSSPTNNTSGTVHSSDSIKSTNNHNLGTRIY